MCGEEVLFPLLGVMGGVDSLLVFLGVMGGVILVV